MPFQRSPATKEKKMRASSDVQNKVVISTFRIHEYLCVQDVSSKQKPLNSTFVMVIKPYRNIIN